MRFPLWLRLFLALAALSGLALAGFAGWQQRDFRQGFLGYLDEMTLERVQPVAPALAASYAEHGNWDFLRDNRELFGRIVEAAVPWHRRRDERPPPPPPRDDPNAPNHDQPDHPGDHGPDSRFDNGRPGEPPEADANGRPDFRPPPRGDRPPPPPRAPPELMPRLLLVDQRDIPVIGNPHVEANAVSIPVLLTGARIGTLRLQRQPQLESDADIAFARSQMRNALIAGIAILAAALLLSFALARWLLSPVRALTAGTRALAAGDFTRRVPAERNDELGALARDFNHLAATLDKHRDARRQWGADIAHELRTPLTILRGEIQALQDGIRPLGATALASLQAECERLGSLIEDLYQLSLADASALEYHFESVDATDLVLEALDLHRPGLADAGLDLIAAIEQVPAVRGDARRLRQLLDNMLANAQRYTDAPGRIRVEFKSDEKRLRLIVEDSPPGVPASALPQLFDRLFRVDRSRSRDAGGAGLGLAICRAIVDAHGGSITASPSPIGGLRVTVHLPLEHA